MDKRWKGNVLFLLGIALGIGFLTSPLRAAMNYRPDENTLWEEDWKSIELSDKSSRDGWRQGTIGFREKGGKTVLYPIEGIKGSHATGRYVDLNPYYPYLQIKISEVKQTSGYKGFSVSNASTGGGPMLGTGGFYYPGIYTLDVVASQRWPEIKERSFFLRMDLHGGEFLFDYIKMVAKPKDAILVKSLNEGKREVLGKGDKIGLEVCLEEPAKDVTVTFIGYTRKSLSLNGEPYVQLVKKDKEGKLWKGEVEITKETLDLKQGGLLMKATILGGKIKETYTANPWPIKTD